MKKLLVACLFMLSTASIYAGGYRVAAQGQRALAMGHTGVAVVNSAELAFFNPAGLSHLEGQLNVSVGFTGVLSQTRWQNQNTGQFSETDSSLGTPFHAYISYKLNETFTAGLAIYTPYGSSVEWEEDWAGSHLVNDINLESIFVQPLISIRLSDEVSIGGGPIFVTGNVNFNRNADRSLTDLEGNRSNVTIDDSGVTNWGWSASMLITPSEKFKAGINYRSEIILASEDGDATFSDFTNSPLTPANTTMGFQAELPLPAELTIGASYKFNDKWLLAFDYNRIFWDVYESLDINFENPSVDNSINPRNYKAASTYRIGVQYKALDKLTLRTGFYSDESPVRDGFFAPETPRNDALGFTGGLSYQVSDQIAIDASFLYVRFEEVTTSYDPYFENGQQAPFEGTYNSNAFLPGIGLTYNL